MKTKPYILLSSCLLGIKTMWDADSKKVDKLIDYVREGKAIFFCPEQGGGLPTPRVPSEIEMGGNSKEVLQKKAKVVNKEGKDVTQQFLKGARMALQLCKEYNLKIAILKSKSPSCGSRETYDGSFTGTKRSGTGITAELLKQNNVKVYNEKNFPNNV